MISSSRSATRAEAGFVLVAVLWILAALATLASIYASYTIDSAVASRVADDRVQADASIRAGVEMAVLRQLAFPERARPARGNFNLHVGRTGVAVRFRSESARIDLNAASVDLLTGLITAVGVDPPRAETLAKRIVGWRTRAWAAVDGKEDANAQVTAGAENTQSGDAAQEDTLYAEQHVPYLPRHAPFDNSLELSLLPGVSPAVVERILPFVTVFSGRPDIDVSNADPTVLSALPGMTPQILGAVLNARVKDPEDGRALLALLGPAKAHATADQSKVFRTSIVVEFDNGRRIHAEVVFRLKDHGGKDRRDEPYELLYWRDDFDSPMHSA